MKVYYHDQLQFTVGQWKHELDDVMQGTTLGEYFASEPEELSLFADACGLTYLTWLAHEQHVPKDQMRNMVIDAGQARRGLNRVVRKASEFTILCSLVNPFQALRMFRSSPELLEMESHEVVSRLLALRKSLPGADISRLVVMKPSFLHDKRAVDKINKALPMLKRLLPHVDVAKKLELQGSVWYSFLGLL